MEYKSSKDTRSVGVVGSGRVGSFTQTLQRVKEQVEFEFFDEIDKSQAEEICLIITEVLFLRDGLEISVGGERLPIEAVKDIYGRLQKEHIEAVMEAFNKITYEIKYKKAYLRKALYNAVFESESNIKNQVAADGHKMGWFW